MTAGKLSQHHFELNTDVSVDAALDKHLRSLAKSNRKSAWIRQALLMTLTAERYAEELANDPETPEQYRRVFAGKITSRKADAYDHPDASANDEPQYVDPEDIP